MAESQVYYMDAHSESTETSLAAKMITVFDAAGLDEIVKPNDVVAIKVHCGEWNNSAYLRPLYARTLADRIKNWEEGRLSVTPQLRPIAHGDLGQVS